MTKNTKAKFTPTPTKHQQIIDLLSREDGVTLDEMSTTAAWQPHSTRAFLTGLKKKGYVVESEKAEGVRHYRITSSPAA
jgi:DNA-binding IclR family transcriptional regulator